MLESPSHTKAELFILSIKNIDVQHIDQLIQKKKVVIPVEGFRSVVIRPSDKAFRKELKSLSKQSHALSDLEEKHVLQKLLLEIKNKKTTYGIKKSHSPKKTKYRELDDETQKKIARHVETLLVEISAKIEKLEHQEPTEIKADAVDAALSPKKQEAPRSLPLRERKIEVQEKSQKEIIRPQQVLEEADIEETHIQQERKQTQEKRHMAKRDLICATEEKRQELRIDLKNYRRKGR